MKTIMHITEVSSGGVLPVIVSICNGLCEEYRFIVLYGIREDTPHNIRELFDNRVTMIPIESMKLKMDVANDLRAIKEIRKYVKQYNPDVVHIHSTKAGILARVGLINSKVRKYYSPHAFCFVRKDTSKLKLSVMKMMEKILAGLCDGIIACGRSEYELAKKLTKSSILIENGLDTKFVDNILSESSQKEHEYTIYTAGRIGPQKGPDLFNKVAESLPGFKFVWVGDGDDRKLLTSSNIEVTGLLSRKDVIRKAIDYDCYLSTSLWEGLPIALMEAMYMGKKCVVSNVNGNNELIRDKETGDLFCEWEQACKKICSNENYGVNAKRIIESCYSLDKMCEKYARVYSFN